MEDAVSRTGLLGLVPKGNGTYRIYNDRGKQVSNCSETGNLLTRSMGRPTTGHAWTRHGVYGDSVIFDRSLLRHAWLNRVVSGTPDADNLKSGDIVDLNGYTSHYNERASREGRGNSHTGTVWKPNNNGPAWIIHNINGTVYMDPLSKFSNIITSPWRISRVSRPGTKEH